MTRRVCIGHGEHRCRVVFDGKGPRCPICAHLHAADAPDRSTGEPWRVVYGWKEWHRARAACKARDGHRCRALIDGQRCKAVSDLQVHHRIPLRVLWQRQLDPCALRYLLTLCPRCHARADEALRANAPNG